MKYKGLIRRPLTCPWELRGGGSRSKKVARPRLARQRARGGHGRADSSPLPDLVGYAPAKVVHSWMGLIGSRSNDVPIATRSVRNRNNRVIPQGGWSAHRSRLPHGVLVVPQIAPHATRWHDPTGTGGIPNEAYGDSAGCDPPWQLGNGKRRTRRPGKRDRRPPTPSNPSPQTHPLPSPAHGK